MRARCTHGYGHAHDYHDEYGRWRSCVMLAGDSSLAIQNQVILPQ